MSLKLHGCIIQLNDGKMLDDVDAYRRGFSSRTELARVGFTEGLPGVANGGTGVTGMNLQRGKSTVVVVVVVNLKWGNLVKRKATTAAAIRLVIL